MDNNMDIDKKINMEDGVQKKRRPVLLPIRSLIFVLTFVAGAAILGKELQDISNWWSVVATVVNLLVLVLLICIAKRDGKTYMEMINYRKGASKAKDVVNMSLVAVFVGMGCMYLAGFLLYGSFMPRVSLTMIAPIPKALAIINVLLLPVTTALAEDGLYLGYGVNRLSDSGVNHDGEYGDARGDDYVRESGGSQSRRRLAAILLPAFFYALQHCFIPTMFDVKYMAYRFLSFLPLTVIFCWNYEKKRNPIPIMAGHVILDFATAMWIFATSVFPGVYDELSNMKF